MLIDSILTVIFVSLEKENAIFSAKKFGHVKKSPYLCTRF